MDSMTVNCGVSRRISASSANKKFENKKHNIRRKIALRNREIISIAHFNFQSLLYSPFKLHFFMFFVKFRLILNQRNSWFCHTHIDRVMGWVNPLNICICGKYFTNWRFDSVFYMVPKIARFQHFP